MNIHRTVVVVVILLCSMSAMAQRRGRIAGFPSLDASDDVAYLERVATSPEEAQKVPGVNNTGILESASDARIAAYIRLGKLDTPASRAAIQRIEASARTATLLPATFAMGRVGRPLGGSDEISPLAKVTAPDGVCYALVRDAILGRQELFVVSTKAPDDPRSWSRPLATGVLDYPGTQDHSLLLRGKDTLLCTYEQRALPQYLLDKANPAATAAGTHSVQISLAEIRKDSDRDGWTDLEERRLGLDPMNPNTDRDGTADGSDICPDYPTPPDEAQSDSSQVIQLAIFATVGLTGSRMVWLANPESQKTPFWGLSAPVLYRWTASQWSSQGNSSLTVGWTITKMADTLATVQIKYAGLARSGTYLITLQKTNARWYVVERVLEYAASA